MAQYIILEEERDELEHVFAYLENNTNIDEAKRILKSVRQYNQNNDYSLVQVIISEDEEV